MNGISSISHAAPVDPRVPHSGFLGLERAIRRLVAEDGFRCPMEAARWIQEYEGFFLSLATSHDTPLYPKRNVDLVWQRHLLDTEAYTRDCHRWVGGYIHRKPGTSGELSAMVDRKSTAAWHGPTGSLDQEDFTSLTEKVCLSLAQKPVVAPWIEQGIQLLESDPESVVREYRRFLELVIAGGGPSTPSKLVDEFWHQHILNSEEYFSFCERVAGRYLHHRPHYEKRHRFHSPRFRETKARYLARFGSTPDPRVWRHLGESGGDSEPDPLYEIDTETSVTAVLTCGSVDGRHFSNLHPVLAAKGLSWKSWTRFLDDVDGITKMPIRKLGDRSAPRIVLGI